jgi:hypothetical protein
LSHSLWFVTSALFGDFCTSKPRPVSPNQSHAIPSSLPPSKCIHVAGVLIRRSAALFWECNRIESVTLCLIHHGGSTTGVYLQIGSWQIQIRPRPDPDPSRATAWRIGVPWKIFAETPSLLADATTNIPLYVVSLDVLRTLRIVLRCDSTPAY